MKESRIAVVGWLAAWLLGLSLVATVVGATLVERRSAGTWTSAFFGASVAAFVLVLCGILYRAWARMAWGAPFVVGDRVRVVRGASAGHRGVVSLLGQGVVVEVLLADGRALREVPWGALRRDAKAGDLSMLVAGSARLSVQARIAITAGVSFAGALWLSFTGPVPVVRISTPLPEVAPLWYLVSAFVVLGMVVADLVEEACIGLRRRQPWILGIQTATLVVVSNLRLAVRLPVSGHAALFAFFILYRVLRSRHGLRPIGRWEVLAATGLLLATAYVKLVWWTDAVTLVVGVVFGGVLAVLGYQVRPRSLDSDGRRS